MFYTSIFSKDGNVHHFYREGFDKYIKTDGNFCPSVFVDDSNGLYRDIKTGNRVSELKFNSIYSYYRYDKDTKRVYNDISPKYQYIGKNYRNEIDYSFKFIKWANIDIENPAPRHLGFPDPEDAKYEIKTITMFITQDHKTSKYVFGFNDYISDGNVQYIKCENERVLFENFLKVWIREYPDVITGWNIDNFDIPYIIKRMELYGLSAYLSPIGIVNVKPNLAYEKLKKMKSGFRYNPKYRSTIAGVEILDYYWMFRKFRSNNMESFRLGFIGEIELGMAKIDFGADGYKDHYSFYMADFQKFVDYNIRDVEIVQKLEDKLKFLDLMISFAYLAKVNYSDVYSPVKCWEAFLYNILYKHRYVLPCRRPTTGNEFVGAWTMERTPAYFKWILALDLDSLYPHIIMQYNMSYECKIGYIHEYVKMEPLSIQSVDSRLLNRELDLSMLREKQWTMAGSGLLFDKSKKGIIVQILSDIYADRKRIKKEQKILEQQYEDTGDKSLIPEIASRNSKQSAIKVFLNSYYGIMGNESYILYDVDMALAVTLSAQLSIRWIIDYTKANVDPKFGYEVAYGDTDSVTGDSSITIMTDNGRPCRMKISKLYDAIQNNCEIISISNGRSVLKPRSEIQILSYDTKTREPVYKKIEYIMAKNNVKDLYQIKAENNPAMVEITEDHSIILDRNGLCCDIRPLHIDNNDKLIIFV